MIRFVELLDSFSNQTMTIYVAKFHLNVIKGEPVYTFYKNSLYKDAFLVISYLGKFLIDFL